MPANVSREDVQRMLAGGALLVDALPEDEYAEEHIAGAVNVPLKSLSRASAELLPRDRPLIVYCFDTD